MMLAVFFFQFLIFSISFILFIYFYYLFYLFSSIVDRPHKLVSCYYYRAKIKVFFFFFFFFLILTCPLIFLDIFPFHDYLKDFLKHVLLNSCPPHNKKGGRLIVTGILISPMDSFM